MKTQRILFLLCLIALAGCLISFTRTTQLRTRGIELVNDGQYDKLKDLIQGRPWLATQLLGYTFQANRRDMFEMLLKHGANVNVANLQTEWGPYPLLHHFARQDEIYWLETSFSYGGDPNRRTRFGITPLWSAMEACQSKSAMATIEAGGNIYGQMKNQPYFDMMVESMLFEPAYKMLEMGVNPAEDLGKFPRATSRLRQCCTGIGLDEDSVRRAREDVWFHKIIAWYRERDLDIENAYYEPSKNGHPGGWRIPSFSARERRDDASP